MNEIAFKNHEDALKVAEILLKEDYVVMLSYEENLIIVNYLWSHNGADRNDVVFMDKFEYGEEFEKFHDDIIDELRKDGKLK